MTPRARSLTIGLDGATWDVIEPNRALLPNLWRLRQTGAWARLNSTTPPMTLPSWSSVLTGCKPGTHGILDFTRRDPGTYALSFLNATHRRVPTLHRILSDRGGRVASIAVPTTFPPEALNGLVVAGFDSPVATTAEVRHVQPAAAWPELERRFGGLHFADFQEGDIGPGWHAHARSSLLREIGRKEALCAHLLDSEPWDHFMVVFGESDTAAHHFWMFYDSSSPRHAAACALPGADRVKDTLLEVYARLDAAVGRLAARADVVAICSDHGFGGANDIALYLNRFLEQRGWLKFRDAPGLGVGDRFRRAALAVPSRSLERVIRRVPPAWLGRTETRSRYGPIDFPGTRAWSDEMNYAATVHLNVRGRDPDGQVENVPLAVADLTRELLAWEVDGHRVVEAVHADAYDGAPGAPDLVLTLALNAGGSYTLLPSTRVESGTLWRRLERSEHPGGKGLGMNGAHRQHGVLLLNGPMFRAGEVDASVWDLAPTLLHALGEAIPEHMEGCVLPVFHTLDAPRRAPVGAPVSTLDASARPGDDEAIRLRLAKLGYL